MSTKKTTAKPAPKPTKTQTSAKQKPRAKQADVKSEKSPKAPRTGKVDGKLSALDAAAKVLAESKEPLTTRQMIEAMRDSEQPAETGGKAGVCGPCNVGSNVTAAAPASLAGTEPSPGPTADPALARLLRLWPVLTDADRREILSRAQELCRSSANLSKLDPEFG